MNPLLVGEMVDLFKKGFEWSRVREGETVLIYTDPSFEYPEYATAAFAAARTLGAEVYAMSGPPREITYRDKMVIEAWKKADLVVNIAWPGVWIYGREHMEVLESGTRVLAARGRPETMRAMLPTREVIDRCYAAARRLEKAREIRVTSRAGSDFVMRKEGRKAHVQIGVVDSTGMWDNLGSGFVAAAPLEFSTEGTYVIAPGDIILVKPNRHVMTPIRLTFREGVVTDIQGGSDAFTIVRDRLDRHGNRDVYRMSHAGWGMHKAADWNTPFGQNAESFYGSLMLSLGNNIFDTPHPNRGFGGANHCPGHMDICCRNASLYLDGELVVDEGTMVPDELK